jgi:hypothetical protein
MEQNAGKVVTFCACDPHILATMAAERHLAGGHASWALQVCYGMHTFQIAQQKRCEGTCRAVPSPHTGEG